MTERFEMRLGQSVLEKIDSWRADQADIPSRSEAIRRLVEAGLDVGQRDKQIKFSDGYQTGRGNALPVVQTLEGKE